MEMDNPLGSKGRDGMGDGGVRNVSQVNQKYHSEAGVSQRFEKPWIIRFPQQISILQDE